MQILEWGTSLLLSLFHQSLNDVTELPDPAAMEFY